MEKWGNSEKNVLRVLHKKEGKIKTYLVPSVASNCWLEKRDSRIWSLSQCRVLRSLLAVEAHSISYLTDYQEGNFSFKMLKEIYVFVVWACVFMCCMCLCLRVCVCATCVFGDCVWWRGVTGICEYQMCVLRTEPQSSAREVSAQSSLNYISWVIIIRWYLISKISNLLCFITYWKKTLYKNFSHLKFNYKMLSCI